MEHEAENIYLDCCTRVKYMLGELNIVRIKLEVVRSKCERLIKEAEKNHGETCLEQSNAEEERERPFEAGDFTE